MSMIEDESLSLAEKLETWLGTHQKEKIDVIAVLDEGLAQGGSVASLTLLFGRLLSNMLSKEASQAKKAQKCSNCGKKSHLAKDCQNKFAKDPLRGLGNDLLPIAEKLAESDKKALFWPKMEKVMEPKILKVVKELQKTVQDNGPKMTSAETERLQNIEKMEPVKRSRKDITFALKRKTVNSLDDAVELVKKRIIQDFKGAIENKVRPILETASSKMEVDVLLGKRKDHPRDSTVEKKESKTGKKSFNTGLV